MDDRERAKEMAVNGPPALQERVGKPPSRGGPGKAKNNNGNHKRKEEFKTTGDYLRTVFNHVYDAIFIHDTDGKIIDVNDKLLEMYRVSRVEAIDSYIIADYSAPENPVEGLFVRWAKVMAGEDQFFEWKAKRPRDGSVFDVEVFLTKLRLPAGDFVLASVRDITERKRTEEALQESERRFRSLVETTSDWVWETDPRGVYTYSSPKAKELLGWDPEELIGKKPFDHMPGEEAERVAALCREIAKSRKSFSGLQNVVLHKDGHEVVLETSGVPVFDANGKFTGYRGIDRDVTERKRAAEELRKAYDELELRVQERTAELRKAYESLERAMKEQERAEEQVRRSQKMKAIGTLAGGIAHDFNNILAGIIGFTEMVRDEMPRESREYQRLGLVLKGAYRGRDLVKQILTFSRKTDHEQVPVSLSTIVEEGLKMLRPLLPATIEMRLNVLPGDDTILGDPAQIHQVLMNLCTNGAQAMGRRGVLEISVSGNHFRKGDHTASAGMKPGDYVTLSVRDTGSGMKPEVLERIFDPFFTTRAKAEGTGLGLSVVHGIVKSHGGFIRVESEPGKGSMFSIHLPKVERKEDLLPQEEPAAGGGRERILFVDDEDILVELNRERLAQLGYEVTATTSVLEAQEIFRKEPGRFDLVIADYTMPDMTGVDLARKLLKARGDIPIILCTGFNDEISADKARKAGIRGFLLKPQSKAELDQTIRRILDAKAEC